MKKFQILLSTAFISCSLLVMTSCTPEQIEDHFNGAGFPSGIPSLDSLPPVDSLFTGGDCTYNPDTTGWNPDGDSLDAQPGDWGDNNPDWNWNNDTLDGGGSDSLEIDLPDGGNHNGNGNHHGGRGRHHGGRGRNGG